MKDLVFCLATIVNRSLLMWNITVVVEEGNECKYTFLSKAFYLKAVFINSNNVSLVKASCVAMFASKCGGK